MSAQTLTIQYQAAEIDRVTDPYWIRIEPVGQEPETATVSDAANLLDALYQIDPCTESEDQGQLVEQEDYAPTVAATIDLSYCDQEYDGSVEMDIRIIRSHLAESYRLQLQGGELIQTLQVSEQVTRTLEISGQTTLDYPVVSGFACSPEPLKRVGNTLLFDPALDGQTLRATYRTRYDLATVKVLGVEGQPGECRALAFHHGLVADETLTPPEAEQVDRSLCPSTSYESPGREDEVTCYQEVVVHRVCSCSLHEVETLRYEEIVSCPGEMHCANNETRCMHLLGTVSVMEYVQCGDADRSGDFDGDLSDPEFYEAKCCATRYPLPKCVTVHAVYRGGMGIVHGPTHYRGLYGDITRIVPVSPPGGICGEHITEQRLMSNNCCDGVAPLAWDSSISPEVMSPGGTAMVAVTGGGRYPYVWTVSGQGFSFPGGRRTWTTTGPEMTLQAGPDACGTAAIIVTDGCSSIQGHVRATTGQWTNGCVRLHVFETYRSDIAVFATPVDASAEGCALIETGDPEWVYNPAGIAYVTAEAWPMRWSGVSWQPSGLGVIGGDYLADEWVSALARVRVPVIHAPEGVVLTDPPTGAGAAYSCGGDVCEWVCP